MADLGSLIIHIGVDTSGLLTAQTQIKGFTATANAAAVKAAASMEYFSKSTINNLNMVAQRIRTFGYLATVVLTAPIIAFGKSAINMAKDFEFSMSKIEGLAGIPTDMVGEWSTALKTMSVQTGIAPNKLAESLYYVASAGFKSNEALKITEAAAKAAATGMGEAASVADMLVSALNAYKSSGLTAARAMDIFTAAVREGKIEPEAFASTLGSVLPIAAEAGVSLDQVTAAMASMSLSGASAANAATYLRNVLQKLMDPSVEVEKKLNEMGVTSESLRKSLAEQGLMPTLIKLRELTAKYGETMFELFPNIRALIAALNLTGQNLEYNKRVFEEVLQSTGDFDKAFKVASKTLQFQWNQALASAQVSLLTLGNSIGKIVLPFMIRLTKWLGNLATWFDNLTESGKRFAVIAMAVVAALGPLALILSTLIYIHTTLLLGVNKVIAGFKALITWIKGVQAAVVALNIAMQAMIWVAIATAIVLVTTAIIRLIRRGNELERMQKKLIENINAETSALDRDFAALRNTAKGTEERARAIDLVNSKYGDYMKNMLDEKSSLEDIVKAQQAATNAMVARIATEGLQGEKAEILKDLAKSWRKNLSDFMISYQESLKVAGKYSKSSGELVSTFYSEFQKALDQAAATYPIDLEFNARLKAEQGRELTEQQYEKLFGMPPATAKDITLQWKESIYKYLESTDLELAMNWAQTGDMQQWKNSLQEGGRYIQIMRDFYDEFVGTVVDGNGKAVTSFSKFLRQTEDYLNLRKKTDPQLENLQLLIQGYSGVAIQEAAVAEEAGKMWKEINNPVLQKIVKEMEQEEARLIATKNALDRAGVSTKDVDNKLQSLYETAQQDLGATGLQEADKYIKSLQEKIKVIISGLQDTGIELTALQEIMKKFSGENDYLTYMAQNAHRFGLEFDYIKEQADLAKKTLEDLAQNKGLNTDFAKQISDQLKNLPANIYDAVLAFKDLQEQFKYLEEKNKVILNFEINAEKLQALEKTRDILLKVKAEAKNLNSSFIPIGPAIAGGFGQVIPTAQLLDSWIQKLTKDIIEYTDSASAENLELSLKLLREQADAYGSVDNKLAVLSKDIQRTEREMYNIAKTSGVASQAYKDQAYKLSELIAEYIALQGVTDYEYFKNLYESFGRYEESMSMLEVELSGVESQLRAALAVPPDLRDTKYIQNLTAEWGRLKTELENLETVYDSLDSLASIFQDIGEAIGGTTGEMVSWIGELITRIPELIDLFNKYSTAVQATTTATQAQTVAGQISNAVKEEEAVTSGVLATIKGTEAVAIKGSTVATNADNLAKTTSTASTLANSTATATNTALAGVNATAKGAEAVAGATAAGAEEPFPYNIIAIALGVAAVIAALMTSIPKMKKGGVVPAGYPDDTFPAMLTSGEIVIPKEKYKKEFLDSPTMEEKVKELNLPKFAKGGTIPAGYPNDSFPALLSSFEVVLPEDKYKAMIKLVNKAVKDSESPYKEYLDAPFIPHKPKELEIDKLTEKGSLPKGAMNDEFQTMMFSYDVNLPEDKLKALLSSQKKPDVIADQVKKDKALTKIYNYNGISDRLSRLSKVKSGKEETFANKQLVRIFKEATTKNKSLNDISKFSNIKESANGKMVSKYLSKISKEVRMSDIANLTKTRIGKSSYFGEVSKITKAKSIKDKSLDYVAQFTKSKVTKDKSLDYLSKISRTKVNNEKFSNNLIKLSKINSFKDTSLKNIKTTNKATENNTIASKYLSKAVSVKKENDLLTKYLTKISDVSAISNKKSASSEYLNSVFKSQDTASSMSDYLKSSFKDLEINGTTLENISKMKRTNDKSLNFLTRISKGTERNEKNMFSSKYLSGIARMAKGGIVPKGYPRDSYPARLTSGEKVLPPQKLGHLESAKTNIHITLDGEIKNRDLALVIRRIQEMN